LSTHLSNGVFPSAVPTNNPTCPHACCMLCPSHPPLLDRSNYTWRRVKVTKLLVKHPQSMFLPYIRDKVSHLYRTTGKSMVLYILIFTFLHRRQEDERLWTEWYQALPEFSLLIISS
jgi:histone acetyltransferase (RNA polymerase elongator complex component)